ncbi:MAG: Ldh family oxidoreductase [bacterium]
MTKENLKRVKEKDLFKFSVEVIESLGVTKENAETTSKILVGADLRGISSHGVAGGTGLTELLERVRAKAINPDAKTILKHKDGWASATIDGNGGIGPIAAQQATQLVGDLAEKYGIARVFVNNTNHYGAACIYVEELISRGLAARSTCTSGAWMIPFGGDKIRLGTNPIAWGVPGEKFPVVIDMATTQRAVSPAIRASKSSQPIPEDYFVSEEGEPLSGVVPFDILKKGSVRPLGGKQFGYKGSGLCMLVDLDNVIGGGSVKRIPTMRETPLSRVSQTFEAWRIDQFYEQEESLSKLFASIKDIKKSGGEKMLLPGEREAITKLDAEKNGIPYEKSQWETLTKLSKLTGVIVPNSC